MKELIAESVNDYNEQAAAESQVILDKISELLEKDGDSK